jgi:putative tricarboxylic transport membrane protein
MDAAPGSAGRGLPHPPRRDSHRFEGDMRTADLTTALILMGIGALVVWDALRLGIGWGTDGPQSGFFPFWLAVIVLACSASIALKAVRRATRAPFIRREQVAPVLKALLPAAAFVLLTQFIGIYVAAGLYLGVYMRWIGRYSWAGVVVLGVAFPLVTFLVFEKWFLVPMPKGPLEAWLGY